MGGIGASAERMDGIQILAVEEDLDAATADVLYQQGRAAIGRHARLLLLDLSGLSFCDARGLSALVRTANDAESAGCGFGLIAPKPQVAKILRITALDSRFRVFATIEQAFQHRFTTPAASHAPVGVACGA
jgi:anti-sigma B factor antagonist